MISEIGIDNIRIFDGVGWNFDLNSLTIFCGTNGSGKSTILKTLLLLRQCLSIGENFDMRGGRLQFVGSQVDFGNYYSLVSRNNTENKIAIEITVKDFLNLGGEDFSEILSSFLQKTNESNFVERIFEFSLKAKFTFSIDNTEKVDASLKSINDGGIFSKAVFLENANFDLLIGEEYNLRWKVIRNSKIPTYGIVIPQDDLEPLGPFHIIKYEKTGNGNYRAFTRLKGLLPDLVGGKKATQNGDDETREIIGEPVPILIELTQNKLREGLENLDYLGPLRSPAKRYYLSQNNSLSQIDLSGEQLPQVLFDRLNDQNIIINFPLPKETKPEEITLREALNSWIHYFRTGETYQNCQEFDLVITKVLVEILIKGGDGEKLYPLADTGFGYSQVLPIIVRGLLLSEKSCLIVEQPELHLNPALQVRLGEFFLAMALASKQILIETHSEHIVNSIRVCTAESENEELASMLSVYFIDSNDGLPIVHELTIQPDGSIPNWPRSFFGEASTLTSRLLKAQKRFIGRI